MIGCRFPFRTCLFGFQVLQEIILMETINTRLNKDWKSLVLQVKALPNIMLVPQVNARPFFQTARWSSQPRDRSGPNRCCNLPFNCSYLQTLQESIRHFSLQLTVESLFLFILCFNLFSLSSNSFFISYYFLFYAFIIFILRINSL